MLNRCSLIIVFDLDKVIAHQGGCGRSLACLVNLLSRNAGRWCGTPGEQGIAGPGHSPPRMAVRLTLRARPA